MTAPADLRRLLEMAAKAAGHLTRTDRTGVWLVEDDGSPIRRWAPHIDDGDSRRLEVACGMCVTQFPKHGEVWAGVRLGDNAGTNRVELYADHADPCAATRMAVLRAAAAIGEAMP